MLPARSFPIGEKKAARKILLGEKISVRLLSSRRTATGHLVQFGRGA